MPWGRSGVDGDDDVLHGGGGGGSDVVALKLAPILTFARARSDRVDAGNGGSAARMRAIKMKMRLEEAKGPVGA